MSTNTRGMSESTGDDAKLSTKLSTKCSTLQTQDCKHVYLKQ